MLTAYTVSSSEESDPDAPDPWRRLYASARWRNLARRIRAASGYRCWILDCERPATDTDHLIPPAELYTYGELARFFDPANLRPSCSFHNRSAAGRIERDRQIERLRRGEVVVAPAASATDLLTVARLGLASAGGRSRRALR
jgi:hypothetical protein